MTIPSSYNQTRLDGRQLDELIGLARGMLADGHLSDDEITFLHKWLVANEGVTKNPLVTTLVTRIEEALADGVIDEIERADLNDTLQALTSNDFELGEILKSSTLPLCDPAPEIMIPGSRFAFTGTFTFGKRKECEAAMTERGAQAGKLNQKTDYLVIGEYATDSWKHSSFGRKIVQAVEWREKGVPIRIISEAHWRSAL